MQEFGVSVSGKFAEIPARVLDAPALAYKNKIVNVSKGQWTADVFLESSSLISDDNTWTILNLNFRTKPMELDNFASQLRQRGITIIIYAYHMKYNNIIRFVVSITWSIFLQLKA